MPDAPRPTSGLTEPGTPDERDGTDGVTTPERQRGTAVPVSSGPGSARPTSELAADATARARAARSHLKSWYGEYIGADSPRYQEVAALADTIDALLARITDLEALNTGLTRDFNSMLVEQSKQRNRVTDLEARAEGYKRDFLAASERVVAAEAQVAALTQERDAYMKGNLWVGRAADEQRRAEAAEAALAEARQALAEIERMAGAAGPGETRAAPLSSIARRALAATEGEADGSRQAG